MAVMGTAHLELSAGGVGAVPVASGTAHLELTAGGTRPTYTARAVSVLPAATQSATGTFAPPRPGDRPGVGSYALTMATVLTGSGAVAACAVEHNTAGTLGATCALLMVLRSLPRD